MQGNGIISPSPAFSPTSSSSPNHSFCGATWADANTCKFQWCGGVGSDGRGRVTCPDGLSCFAETGCNILDMEPGFDDPENFKFCGESWADASTCRSKWCGIGGGVDGGAAPCPEGQTCFADTGCNLLDMPPTVSPTMAPIAYNDTSNSFFCGATYAEAVEGCSIETHCRSGKQEGCAPGLYCWVGVTCNAMDMLTSPPIESVGPSMNAPLTSPAFDPEGPTRSPAVYDHPRNYFFCGSSWIDASTSCETGGKFRWCPGGSNDECEDGESCWADTTCNMLDHTFQPTLVPTVNPTTGPPSPPTGSPIRYDDPTNTNFCGSSFYDAEDNCSADKHCPSGSPTDCPNGGYCWSVGCNIADIDDGTVATPESITGPPIGSLMLITFCGSSYLDAEENCSPETQCPSGSPADCPNDGYCWVVECNIPAFTVSAATPAPTNGGSEPSPILVPTGKPTTTTGPPIGRPIFTGTPTTGPPTGSPIHNGDLLLTAFCGSSHLDAEENCSAETRCPSGSPADCPNGKYCWEAECNIPSFTVSAATPAPSNGGSEPSPIVVPTGKPTTTIGPVTGSTISTGTPTTGPAGSPSEPYGGRFTRTPFSGLTTGSPSGSPNLYGDSRNIKFCGSSYLDAEENCSVDTHCPSGQDCPNGGECWAVVSCHVMDLVSPFPSRIEAPSDSTNSPPNPPLTQPPVGPEPTVSPTKFASASPLNPSLGPSMSHPSVVTLVSSVVTANPSTGSTSVLATPDVPVTYFPPSEPALLVSSATSAIQIQHLLQSVRSSLENEISFYHLNGAISPSKLYTYDGFLEGLKFFSDIGVNGRYFYLGAGQSELEIEYGIANLALFLAKMADTIQLEHCDPDFISCGMPPGQSFFEHNIRVECSLSSTESGMECPKESGCVCILGILNHFIGVISASSDGNNYPVYSGVDFCKTEKLQSICSLALEHGEVLRWIVPMAHWVYFVQPYHVDGWNYADRLHDFVDGGMFDSEFVGQVGNLSVLGAQATVDSSNEFSSNEKFRQDFFTAMMKLREGMNYVDSKTAGPTTFPSVTIPPHSAYPVAVIVSSPPPIESTNVGTLGPTSIEADNISPPRTSFEPIQPQVSSSSASSFESPSISPANLWPLASDEQPWHKIYVSQHSNGTISKDPDCRTFLAIMCFCLLIQLY